MAPAPSSPVPSSASPAARRPADIPALTGIRGLAACWVVIYHVHEFDAVPSWPGTLLRHGYLAVDLFFVLSGYIMALNYASFFAPGFRWRRYAEFLMRRAGRIYPLYLAMTLLVVAIGLARGSGAPSATLLLQNLLLVQSWGFGGPIDGPGWSISTELAAYLAFPALLAATVRRPAWQAVLVGAASVACVGAISGLSTPASYHYPRMGPLDISWEHTPWPLLRCVLEFTVGLVAYRFDQVGGLARALAHPFAALAVLAVMLAALLMPGADMVFFVAAPVLLLALARGRHVVTRLFGCRLAVFLGEISFAIYLLHWIILPIRHHFEQRLGDLGALTLFYAGLIAGAFLLYTTVEKPARRAVRELERRLLPSEERAGERSRLAAVPNYGGDD